MNHCESDAREDGRDTESDTIGMPAEKLDTSADGSEDEDKLKANDQCQPWCNPTALHGTASDQGHDSEVDAHQDSASKRWVGEGWFKISEQRCDDCGRQHLIKHNALHHR